MTPQEIEAKAYKVATSNTLVKTLTKEELDSLSDYDLECLMWWFLAGNFTASTIREHIKSIADDIIKEFTLITTN